MVQHKSPRRILLVFAGGSVGSALRFLITVPTPTPYGPMLATLVINVVGAFVLGLLVPALLSRVPDPDRHLDLRLLLRTGLLGGFTTYSALGLYTVEMLRDGQPILGIGYAVTTLVAGGGATYLGGWLADQPPGELRSES